MPQYEDFFMHNKFCWFYHLILINFLHEINFLFRLWLQGRIFRIFLPHQTTHSYSDILSFTPIKVRKRETFPWVTKCFFFLDSAKTDIRSERENLFFFLKHFSLPFGDAICNVAILYICCSTHLFIYNKYYVL